MKKGNKTELTIPIQDGYMIKQKEKCHKIINKWLYGINSNVQSKQSKKSLPAWRDPGDENPTFQVLCRCLRIYHRKTIVYI